jgi:molybdopterin synthase sulfur carrier subunit
MVTVKFFAGFREKIGKDEISIAIDETSLENLIGLLDEKHPGIKELIDSGATIAVNRSVAKLTETVKDTDEVAIFPPVSGG